MNQLPNITINHLDGQLGRVATSEDGIAGLVLSGVSTAELGLLEPVLFQSTEDLAARMIVPEDNPLAHREIVQFYAKAGEGSKLWVILMADTTELVDAASTVAKTLLDAAEGQIRILGINRMVPSDYEGTITSGMFEDVTAAIEELNTLALTYRAAHKPFRALLPHLGFDTADFSTLLDLRSLSADNVAIVSWLPEEPVVDTSFVPAIGHTLGKLASIPVNQNLGRVKSGDEGVKNPQLYDLSSALIIGQESRWQALHAKGYIFLRKHFGLPGWFFNDDSTATSATSDYSGLSRARTIDKAHRIAYISMAEELLDDIDIDSSGKIPPAMTGYYQSRVESRIRTQMAGEISDVTAYVDPNQDVLATDSIGMRLRVLPKGQVKYITIDLSFTNPNNN